MNPINPVLNIVILLVFALSLKGVLDYAIHKKPTSPISQWVGAGLLMVSATGFGFGFMHVVLNIAKLIELAFKSVS